MEEKRTYLIDGVEYRFAGSKFKWFMSKNSGVVSRRAKLAKALLVGESTVKGWYNGYNAPGRIELIDGIAEYLGIPREELLVPCGPEEKTELLRECQLEAFCRVYAELKRFLELADLVDHFIWREYRLDAYPASLTEDLVSSSVWPPACVSERELRYGRQGILAPDLHLQLYERAVRKLEAERPWLGNTSAYCELDAFIENYVMGYAYALDDDGREQWVPDPDDIYERVPYEVDGKTVVPLSHMELKAAAAAEALEDMTSRCMGWEL